MGVCTISMILVPQGAEYQAVCRGLNQVKQTVPIVLPLPIGPKPVLRHLETLQRQGFFAVPSLQVLVMGLGGGLTTDRAVGEIVLAQNCLYYPDSGVPLSQSFDPDVTAWLFDRLATRAYLGNGVTSDRLIWSVTEKADLHQKSGADVVDMEGFAALKTLSKAKVAMVRVVSDGCHHNLPDVTSALSPEGSLHPLPLAIGLLRQPIASARLIVGSLKGLRVLQSVTTALFSEAEQI